MTILRRRATSLCRAVSALQGRLDGGWGTDLISVLLGLFVSEDGEGEGTEEEERMEQPHG